MNYLIKDKDGKYLDNTNYIPNSELLELAKKRLPLKWKIDRFGIWFRCSPKVMNKNLPKQGWKIHVSATTLNYKDILSETLDVCIKNNLVFKFLLDKKTILEMNSKPVNRGSSGKFITIYPIDVDEFKNSLGNLYQVLRGFEGPFILSDRRYKDSKVLYYRYGGIIDIQSVKITGEKEAKIVSPQGEKVIDLRLPYWNPPSWVKDPFVNEDSELTQNKDDKKIEPTLGGGNYRIIDALHFSNGGGIYIGRDKNNKEVILKEARPLTAFDSQDNDFVKRLKNEYKLLNKLKHSKFTPTPIEMFTEWEHSFLVEEYMEGLEFGHFISQNNILILSNPKTSGYKTKFKRIKNVLLNIIAFMDYLHKQKISFGDLSVSNVIITNVEMSRIAVIDLETGWDINKDYPSGMYTPGFGTGKDIYYGFENDIYSLAAMIVSSFLPVSKVGNLSRKTLKNILNEFKQDLKLSQLLIDTIFRCFDPDPENRPTLGKIKEEVNKMQISDINFNYDIDMSKIFSNIKEINNYILNIGDYSSIDTPFPTEKNISLTNSLNIAYGVCGIGYSLMKLNGTIPESLRTWLLSNFEFNQYPPGLFMGLSGIAWAFWDMGMEYFSIKILEETSKHELLWQRADVFYGAAGYGMTCLRFYILTNNQEWLDRALEVGDWILKTKNIDEKGNVYWINEEGDTFSGFARGSSGIALFLLYLSYISKKNNYLQIGKRALDFDISFLGETENHLSLYRGKINSDKTETEENVITPYWYDGSAGILTTLLRYYHVTQDTKYMKLINKVIPECMKKYTSFPNLFGGLAGLGNVLLDAYQFLGNEKYLEAAYKIASGIDIFKIEKNEGIIFPGDQLDYISASYGTGSSGIALFLKRLVNPSKTYNFNFLLDEIFYLRE